MQVWLRLRKVDWWWKKKPWTVWAWHEQSAIVSTWCCPSRVGDVYLISLPQGHCQQCQREPMSSSLWWRTWRMIVGRLLLWNRTATESSCQWILHPQPSLADINSRWKQVAQPARPFPHMTQLMTSTCCSTPGAKVQKHFAMQYHVKPSSEPKTGESAKWGSLKSVVIYCSSSW